MTFTRRAVHVAAAILLCTFYSVAQQPANLSPREQLQQYVTQLQASPSDDALRTKIIQLALTLDPKPAVPEEAAVADGKAKTIFSHATSPDDLKAAAAAFAQASLLAPWVPDYYFNEGAALEKAGQFDDAIRAFSFYLLAAPNASDAGEVKGKIEGIKFEEQKSAQQKAEQAARAQEIARENARKFAGRWHWLGSGRPFSDVALTIEIEGSSGSYTCSVDPSSPPSRGPLTFRLNIQRCDDSSGRLNIVMTMETISPQIRVDEFSYYTLTLQISADGQSMAGTEQVTGAEEANSVSFQRE